MEYLFRFLRLYNKTSVAHPPDQVERFFWAVFVFLILAVIIIQVAIAVAGYIRKKKDEPAKESFKKKFLRSLVINLVIVILFFVCWKFAVRIYYSRNFKKHPFANPIKSWRLTPGLKNHHRLKNPFGTATIIDSNSEGLRNEEVPAEKEPGEIRILCLGDSWTIGQSVKDKETFVRQLEKMLQEEYPDKKIRIINAGMFGYSILYAYYLFREIRPKYKPDILISCGYNDVATGEIEMYEEAINQLGPLGFIREFLNKSLVYLCLKKTISRFRNTGKSRRNETIDTETAKKLYIKYSSNIYRESEKHGITTIVFDKVALLPHYREYLTTPEGHRYCQMPHDLSFRYDDKKNKGIKRRFKGVHFYCIEPVGITGERFHHKQDWAHPSPQGHKSIAETLFHIIKEGSYMK